MTRFLWRGLSASILLSACGTQEPTDDCSGCAGDSTESGATSNPVTGSSGGADAAGLTPTGGTVSTGGATATTGGALITDGILGTGAGTSTGGSTTDGGPGTGGVPTVTPMPGAPFQNPLNNSHGSDPWLTYYEGNYYLAATTWGDTLTMKKGATIAKLKEATPEVIWEDDNASRCCNMWAPEFFLLDGPNGQRWYYYYTAGDGDDLGTQRSYVLESEGLDPMGPYHFQGQLLNYWAIDGSILEVNGGRYFMFSAWDGPTQNIYIMEMTNPWTVTGPRTRLSWPEYSWEQEGSDSVNEGPEPLQHNGRTFLTYSASQCADPGYKLGLLELIGSDPLDAESWWKSETPVFQAANGAYGSAHNGFFTSPDGTESWIVYHATSNSNGSCWTDRTTRVQPFDWNEDGTPDFGEPLPLSTTLDGPSGELVSDAN